MSRSGDGMFDGFKDGDVVEVTIKGKLSIMDYMGFTAHYVSGSYMTEGIVQTVRLVEPQYEHAAPYMDTRGDVYRFWNFGNGKQHWSRTGMSGHVEFDGPTRPLRKLVPES